MRTEEGIRKKKISDRRYAVSKKGREAHRRALRAYFWRKAGHNLTEDQYWVLFKTQNGVCAVCGEPPNTKRLAVDHDHQTGEIRGLLCMHCNTALGKMRDSPDLLRKLLGYLEQNIEKNKELSNQQLPSKEKICHGRRSKRISRLPKFS
jgi:hypothetical protein